jgi:hypothetical protein
MSTDERSARVCPVLGTARAGARHRDHIASAPCGGVSRVGRIRRSWLAPQPGLVGVAYPAGTLMQLTLSPMNKRPSMSECFAVRPLARRWESELFSQEPWRMRTSSG